MKKVAVYIDGFNLYHALDDLNEDYLKWLDLWSLSKSLLRDEEELKIVKFFSAYPQWRSTSLLLHKYYVKALKVVGVEVILGNFKKRYIFCKECKKRFITREEKETDVNIGGHFIMDGMQNKYDRAIIISADTDLRGVIKLAKEQMPDKEIFVATPPGRYRQSRDLNPGMEITKGRIKKHLLPEEIINKESVIVVTRPQKYNPK